MAKAVEESAGLMRIYTDEASRAGHSSLFEAVVRKARDCGMSGATVLRGPMGYGHSHHIHNASILNLSTDLPVVIEIVDEEAKLRKFLDELTGFDGIGLVTLEKVQILHRSTPE